MVLAVGDGCRLRGNLIGDAGAVQLGALFAKNTSVMTININNNNIGDAGAAGMCAGLAENTSVTSINLGR